MRTENGKAHKIVYFLDYGKFFGGASNTLLRQAVLMKKSGCSVAIFFSDYYGRSVEREYKEICSRHGVEISYAAFQISSQPEDIDVICLDENYEVLKEKIQTLNPDILHSVQINPMVELISRELDIPHIMNIYPLLPEFFSFPYMDIFPHYHICDSWYWAEQWNRYLKTDYTCIRTTVDADARIIQLIDPGKCVKYICVGNMDPRKNQLSVIKAFHAAFKAGVRGRLSFFGYAGDSYTDECKSYIENNGLSEYISIEGFCQDMKDVYRNSDVLICGSTRESYPNAISEAMAFGLVIISTPVAGVPEIIKDGINGYLADDYTAEAISRKILEFQEDVGKEKLKKIMECAYETFMNNHSPELVTEKLKKYYSHVIQDDNKKNVKITDIRERFLPWKSLYYQNYSRFSDSKKVAGKIWYLSYAKEYIDSAVQREAQFFIWGTGKYGVIVKEIVEVFLSEVIISGFIDSNRMGMFEGYSIYKPQGVIEKKNTVVFVAAINGQLEILSQLENCGRVFNKDYFILAPRAW